MRKALNALNHSTYKRNCAKRVHENLHANEHRCSLRFLNNNNNDNIPLHFNAKESMYYVCACNLQLFPDFFIQRCRF